MDSGGQKGVKKYIKEALQEDGFVYTPEGMAGKILDGAVYTAIQECIWLYIFEKIVIAIAEECACILKCFKPVESI